MLPVIALVGRPNVGKSTLFNVLTGTRDAIVADVSGLTRDRQYGFGRLGPVPYVVIDTGGLLENPQGIEAQMRAQTERAKGILMERYQVDRDDHGSLHRAALELGLTLRLLAHR